MEEMNKKVNKDMCDCSADEAFHLRPGMARRLVMMVFLVMIAFWFGMELGEIKGYIKADRTDSSMHRGTMMYDIRDMELRKVTPVKVELPATPVTPTPATAPTN